LNDVKIIANIICSFLLVQNRKFANFRMYVMIFQMLNIPVHFK